MRRTLSGAITDEQLVLQHQGPCSNCTCTTRAEQLHEDDEKVDGEDEEANSLILGIRHQHPHRGAFLMEDVKSVMAAKPTQFAGGQQREFRSSGRAAEVYFLAALLFALGVLWFYLSVTQYGSGMLDLIGVALVLVPFWIVHRARGRVRENRVVFSDEGVTQYRYPGIVQSIAWDKIEKVTEIGLGSGEMGDASALRLQAGDARMEIGNDEYSGRAWIAIKGIVRSKVPFRSDFPV